MRLDRQTTIDRWRRLGWRLIELAQAVEAQQVQQIEAEREVGKLAAREALALRASSPIGGGDE